MRKKIVTTLFIGIACVLAACFAACGGTDVAGKTFVFDDITVTYADTVTEADKKSTDAMVGGMKTGMKDATISFGTDGTVSMKQAGQTTNGTYTQNGGELSVTVNGTTQTLKVEGDTVKVENSANGITMTMTYKLQ